MEYFGKAGLNGQTAKLTTVKQVREIGSAVLTCEDLSNWATDTPVFFATYKVDIDTQKIVPNSQINWRGKVNVENNTIIEIQADSDTPDKETLSEILSNACQLLVGQIRWLMEFR